MAFGAAAAAARRVAERLGEGKRVVTLFPDGASVSRHDFPGVTIADPPDYATVARGCGAHGERVEDPERLVDALTEALKAVRSGRCAVVDVILDAI